MNQSTLLLALGGIAALALASQAGANVWQSGADPSPPLYPGPDEATAAAAADEIMNQPTLDNRVSAMLATIRRFESRGDYSIIYGGGRFDDFSQHPRRAIPINLPGYEGKKSTAAGAYQINAPTYDDFAPSLGVTDFSPASQDALALAILQRTGAYDALLQGDIAGAFRLASSRWASLPGSTAQQHPQSETAALSIFDQMLQTFPA